MPRYTYITSALQNASPGLGKLAGAIAGAGKTGQDAYDAELLTQSKLGQALAQMRLEQAKTDELNHGLALQSPESTRNRAMLEAGIPLQAGPLVDDYLQTGKVGLWKPGAEPGLKGAPSAPSWWDASKIGPLASRIAAATAVQAGEAKGAEDYYKGQNQLFETGLARDIVKGAMPADQSARGMALMKATPLYKIPEGYSGNQFTGGIDVSTPVNFARQGLVGAQTQAQKANAVQSLASAEASRASAAKSRQETQQGQGAGKAPPGYMWGPTDPATGQPTMIAVRGGPADLKQQGVLNQDTASLTNATSAFDRLSTAANALLNHPGLAGITGWQGSIPNAPGSEASDAEAQLGTLKSQIGFNVLQEMRNASKTGGALGAVSDAEGKRLENNLAALEKSQSLAQFQKSLKDIMTYSEQAKDRLRQAYNMKHGGAPAPAPAARQVIRTGRDAAGRKVVQYNDGSIEHAD